MYLLNNLLNILSILKEIQAQEREDLILMQTENRENFYIPLTYLNKKQCLNKKLDKTILPKNLKKRKYSKPHAMKIKIKNNLSQIIKTKRLLKSLATSHVKKFFVLVFDTS